MAPWGQRIGVFDPVDAAFLELDAGVGKTRPGGIGIDSRGNVWFADAQKHSLCRIDAAMVPKLWPKPGASHALPPDNRASKARRP